jgi:ABC-type nitrate/sulfonate/bicarbonate transport system substrate-binding protein
MTENGRARHSSALSAKPRAHTIEVNANKDVGGAPVLSFTRKMIPLGVMVPMLALAPLFATGAAAQSPKQITVNSFKGSNVWPIWAAQQQGFFAKEGLAIKNVYTANSVAQMTGLIKGEFDMVTTALDNVIAYAEGEGAPNAPKEADLAAVLGGNNGGLTLIGRPGIKNAAEFAGKDLAVDAISTGFSFVLQDMLARAGVKQGSYKLVAFGNTGARLKAMDEGKAVGAILTPPLSLGAVMRGYANLGDAASVLGGYQGSVAAARREWAKANADTVVAFIRGYRAGLAWLQAPANKQGALAILRAEMPEVDQAGAEENYTIQVADPKGFDPGGKLDLAGAKEVLSLRRQYGPQGKPATDIGRFIDESYYERALK